MQASNSGSRFWAFVVLAAGALFAAAFSRNGDLPVVASAANSNSANSTTGNSPTSQLAQHSSARGVPAEPTRVEMGPANAPAQPATNAWRATTDFATSRRVAGQLPSTVFSKSATPAAVTPPVLPTGHTLAGTRVDSSLSLPSIREAVGGHTQLPEWAPTKSPLDELIKNSPLSQSADRERSRLREHQAWLPGDEIANSRATAPASGNSPTRPDLDDEQLGSEWRNYEWSSTENQPLAESRYSPTVAKAQSSPQWPDRELSQRGLLPPEMASTTFAPPQPPAGSNLAGSNSAGSNSARGNSGGNTSAGSLVGRTRPRFGRPPASTTAPRVTGESQQASPNQQTPPPTASQNSDARNFVFQPSLRNP